jgi:hypothetical protein
VCGGNAVPQNLEENLSSNSFRNTLWLKLGGLPSLSYIFNLVSVFRVVKWAWSIIKESSNYDANKTMLVFLGGNRESTFLKLMPGISPQVPGIFLPSHRDRSVQTFDITEKLSSIRIGDN